MESMAAIILRLELNGQAVTSQIINDLITDHKPLHDKMVSNYKRYKVSEDPDGVPVFSRKFVDKNKINRKLNDAFDADIVDVKLGYMLGNPVIYGLDKEAYTVGETLNESAYDMAQTVVDDFNKRNNMEDLDGETLKMASICGYGARLLYNNQDGAESAMNVNPWECIFVTDGSINEAQYAMRYFEMMDNGKERIYVEWYDGTNISFYISTDELAKDKADADLVYIPFEKDGKTVLKHMFAGIPLIEFSNNEEDMGDCDKVYSLIDAYDTTLSDVNSELEQFRLAYMAFYGMKPDQQTIDEAKQTGAFGLPDPAARVEFITKELDDTIIENHLDRLEDNIYRFAKSVNFKDESFSGNVSGIAMKFKMFGLESKSVMSERKFTAALRTQYKILASYWATKGETIDYMDVTFVWTRNFPLNLLDEADTTLKLKGLISEATRLGLLSFIDDPEKEKAAMEQENEGMVDLDDPPELDENGKPIEKEVTE